MGSPFARCAVVSPWLAKGQWVDAPSSMTKQILAFGGGGPTPAGDSVLVDHFLGLTGADSPRVCIVPTATGDNDLFVAAFYRAMLRRGARPADLQLFHRDDAA